MTKKRAGRIPKVQTQNREEYTKGYGVGWARARRKSEGRIPITRKSKDKLKNEDYQKGLKDGLAAGRRYYDGGKRK
jgi:hypothetical protein